MQAPDPEPARPFPVWRWLRWYPLVLVALAAVLWWIAPRDGRVDQQDRAEPTAPVAPDPLPEGAAEAVPPAEEGPSLLGRGVERAVALEGAAERVAGAFGLRLKEGVLGLRERVGPDELERGGLKAARLTPFVGPYLRYQRARDLFATEDTEQMDQARRQTVLALAELSLDVGAAGLGHAGAGTEGLLQAMEGVVEAADFADFALSLHAELGAPLGFAGLDALDAQLDGLAATALLEIDGLEPFIDQLLIVQPPEWLAAVPPELVEEAQELLAELLAASGAAR